MRDNYRFNSRVPRYNDDSNYTTNAPSYYDDLARKNALLEKLAQRIWEYQEIIDKQFSEWDEELQKRFLEWDKNLEEFDDEVLRLLQEWIDDGTFAEIINEEIFSWKADKTYVDDEFSRLDSELNKKADKTYVDDEFLRVYNELNKKVDKNKLVLNIKDFGAVGDGVTDDSQSLIDALEYLKNNNGGKLKIPEGTYYTRGIFDVTSNITFEGEGKTTVFKRDDQSMMFRINGNFSDETSVTQNSIVGDHYITVSNTDNFNIGDYIRIVSQRSAFNDVDAGDYYLGHPTSSAHTVYFGEYRKISSINAGTGQLFFRGGLIFPDYLSHDNDETDHLARRNATVEKANFVENVVFKDMMFDGAFSNIMRFDIAVHCHVENVHAINMVQGDFVSFHNSLLCHARHCTLSYTPNFTPPNHYSRNGFKTASSDSCGFDNIEVDHGTQCVDFTYTTNANILSIPNVNSYLTNSKISNALYHTMTSHPGCLNSFVSNNIMTKAVRDGIFSRSRKSVVTNNVVSKGTGDSSSGSNFGVMVSHDASMDSLVEGNNISGFDVGVRTHDNVNTEIKKLNLSILNNKVTGANRGVQLRRNTGSTFTGDSNVFIRGNTFTEFTGEYGKLIEIFDHYFNIFIEDNYFEINSHLNGGIYSRGNSAKIYVNNNKFSNIDSSFSVLWFLDVTGEDIPYRGYSFNNNISNLIRFTENNFITGNLTNNVSDIRYTNISPNENNTHSLGTPSYRWRYLYSMNHPDVVSDRRLKENIKDETLGLDFIQQLKPVTFNLKDDDTLKHGFIAQDIAEIIEDGSIVKAPNEEREYYSMEHEQLIPIIVRAIQELQDK